MKTMILSAVMTLGLALTPAVAGAQQVNPFEEVCQGGKAANSAACKDQQAARKDNPVYGPNGFLTKIINVLSILVGIAAVIGIIIGGFRFITSGNNPQEVTKAREIVLYALIGVVVAVLAQIIVRFFLSTLPEI